MAFFDVATVFDLILLAAAFVLGAVTSYEDFSKGIIRNSLVFPAIIFGILANLLSIFAGTHYFVSFISNFLAALFIALALWHFGVWSAGDAKLFAAFAALLPLSIFQNRLVSIMPFIDLLVNTVVPLSIYLIAISFLRTDSGEKLKILRKSFNLQALLDVFLFAFAVAGARGIISGVFETNLEIGTLGMISAAAFVLLRKIIASAVFRPVLAAAFLARVIYSLANGSTTNLVWESAALFLFSVGFAIILQFVNNLSFFWFNSSADFSDLKPGMLLAETVVKTRTGNYGLKRFDSRVPASSVLKLHDGELSEEDLRRLLKLKTEGKIIPSRISVVQTLPFAPAMFLGAAVTLLFRGNALIFFASII